VEFLTKKSKVLAMLLRKGLGSNVRRMASITSNVSYDTVAREWRCKWSGDSDKASLVALQDQLKAFESKIKSVKGVKKVQRIVCGGCLDFKVITSLDAASFGAWAEGGFSPESEVLEAWKKIPNVTSVETQTYTIMDV